jgi:hypothetical protein
MEPHQRECEINASFTGAPRSNFCPRMLEAFDRRTRRPRWATRPFANNARVSPSSPARGIDEDQLSAGVPPGRKR